MGCFPCFDSNEAKYHYESKIGGGEHAERDDIKKMGKPMIPPNIHRLTSSSKTDNPRTKRTSLSKKEPVNQKEVLGTDISAQKFTFRELSAATKNFKAECFLGEGGFGRVYKGCLPNGQIVAVKQLDTNGLQGTREFLVEVIMLCVLHHPNLVNLIGYCYDGEQRLLVYEFMPLGSLEDHLHETRPDTKPLDWTTRMNIAAGAARGLEHLHDKASPPVIYRDFKAANILLDEAFNPKLSDFGLAKLGPSGDKSHVSTRVMGTYGYCAPEYAMTGQLTIKSDVYSFGVVLLELITGRKAYDSHRPNGEQSLVAWARPKFNDRKKLPKLADPRMEGRYPMRALYQALAIASMCIQEDATSRPLIADVVTALSYLASQSYDPNNPLSRHREKKGILNEHDSSDKDDSPKQVAAGVLNVDFDREKAIAEAKTWGRKAIETSSSGVDV